MSQPPRDDRVTPILDVLPPEYRELAEWLTDTLWPELTAKVIAIGLPPDLAEMVAKEAVNAVVAKITRGAEFYAAVCRARESRTKPS